MAERDDWNRSIIEEFHANAGVVGGPFDGTPLLLLHTTGARSGQERVNPLAYQHLDHGVAVFASKGGAPTHPDWYHNLVANPDVTAEIGTTAARYLAAYRATGDERQRIWTKQKQDHPGFAEYEEKTDREIPVIVLEPT